MVYSMYFIGYSRCMCLINVIQNVNRLSQILLGEHFE
jgi:hypothetical protein